MASDERTVLIGTSLSAESGAVVDAGLAAARALGAGATLLHVVALPQPLARLLGIDSPGREALQELETEARRQMADRAGGSGDGPEVSVKVVVGSPHRVLVEEARRRGAELLVVGTSEGGARPLGSTAERVARGAPCPVLVVRDGLPLPPSRVIVAVDFSPLSVAAFAAGLAWLAEICRGSAPEVTALFVLGPQDSYIGDVEVDLDSAQRAAGERLRRLAVRYGEGLAGEVRPAVRRGEARQGILAEIAERRADLVLLGTHGYGGLERLLLGSVTAAVLHRTPSSALVLPPG